MEENNVRVHISDLAFGGEGIGRIGGKVCFVPYTAPGDYAEVRITESKKKYDRGKLVRILEAGESRVDAACPYFGLCGGCSWQHIDYPVQLEAKRSHLEHLLVRRAGIDVEIPSPVPSPRIYGWRRTARLSVIPPASLGFRRARSTDSVKIERCPVLEEALNNILPDIRAELARAHEKASSEASAKAPKEITAESAVTSAAKSRAKNAGHFPEEVEIFRRPGEEEGDEASYSFGRTDFLQANEEVNSLLKAEIRRVFSGQEAVSGLESEGESPRTEGLDSESGTSRYRGEKLLDLFCGDGNLSLHLAGLFEAVEGYDSSAGAIARAQREADRRGLAGFRYRKARFPGILAGIRKKIRRDGQVFSAVLLDPPRRGLMGRAKETAEPGIHTIIYVSCMPAVLARDLQILTQYGGYEVERVRLFDMFPHSSHVETLVVLRQT